MPRSREYAAHYADALTALAAATHRPANVVNTGDGYAIRVDFEYSRYLLATNHADGGLNDDVSAVDRWVVRIFQDVTDAAPELLVETEAEWLVDAFDRAIRDLGRGKNRIVADLELGELSSAGES